MGALRRIAIGAALIFATPAGAQSAPDPVMQWWPLIAQASRTFGIPEAWIVTVMRAESGGRTMMNGRPITSRAGAMGLMQLMPATYAEMRRRLGLGPNPHDPRDNIHAGAAYLKLMYDRFGYPGLFAAYNAGPGRYAEYRAGTRALPGETRLYLASVAGNAGVPARQPNDGLFFPLRNASAPLEDHRSDALFAVLQGR